MVILIWAVQNSLTTVKAYSLRSYGSVQWHCRYIHLSDEKKKKNTCWNCRQVPRNNHVGHNNRTVNRLRKWSAYAISHRCLHRPDYLERCSLKCETLISLIHYLCRVHRSHDSASKQGQLTREQWWGTCPTQTFNSYKQYNTALRVATGCMKDTKIHEETHAILIPLQESTWTPQTERITTPSESPTQPTPTTPHDLTTSHSGASNKQYFRTITHQP